MRNSVLEELRVRRLADIQEEISCRAVWRWEILESKLRGWKEKKSWVSSAWRWWFRESEEIRVLSGWYTWREDREQSLLEQQNMRIAGLRKWWDMIRESKIFIKDKTKVACKMSSIEWRVVYFRKLLFKTNNEKFSLGRVTVQVRRFTHRRDSIHSALIIAIMLSRAKMVINSHVNGTCFSLRKCLSTDTTEFRWERSTVSEKYGTKLILKKLRDYSKHFWRMINK